MTSFSTQLWDKWPKYFSD